MAMLVEVINYGFGRKSFPTRVGNLFIDRLKPFFVTDPGILEDLKRYEKSDKLGFSTKEQDWKSSEFAKHPINDLRRVAAQMGIKDVFAMKKSKLIQILEENNGPRTVPEN